MDQTDGRQGPVGEVAQLPRHMEDVGRRFRIHARPVVERVADGGGGNAGRFSDLRHVHFHFPSAPFRNSWGVMPVTRLNCLEK